MNLHFLSFVMDMFSWIVFGFLYGRYIHRFTGIQKNSRNIVSLQMSLIAFVGGLIATVDRALPAYGFAYYQFSVAMFAAIVYSIRYFKPIKKYVRSQIRYLLKVTLLPMRIITKSRSGRGV
ncbi:MAG TPA: hypothetical protein VNA13_03445 [Xanthomonadales bacterium]|nr:hypothetical protein [Xanthomonadales bacterium]